MLFSLLLAGIGFTIGAFGTIIGVAGGFILVPVLLFLYPDKEPGTITAISLTVAFFNAVSGSVAYARQKRIDIRSGLLFSSSAIPGSVLGAIITSYLDRGGFQIVFGSILLVVAAYLLIRPTRKYKGLLLEEGVGRVAYNRPLGVGIAFVVGLVAGLLGIGGGIIHVPVLTQVLNFPVHIATATSQFVVATTTLAAGITRALSDSFAGVAGETLVLAVGAVAGAQVGARLAKRIPGKHIVRLLAISLAVVAVRLLFAPL